MPLTRRAVLASAAASLTAGPAAAAPSARLLGPEWRRTGSGADPDHAPWDRFLAAHLSRGADGIARVGYAAARRDLPALRAYIAALEATDPTALAAPAAMAYWINLYNAVTVALVLEAYPVDSIREVRGGLLNTGPWDVETTRVNGTALTLDDIEHGILRPVWRDPRIHYAVNCASIGCPDLAPRAYRSATLETMLEDGARAYVNHPRGARLDEGRLVVSSIYDWFQADFGGTESGVLDHLRHNAAAPLRSQLDGRSGYDDHDYDWSLNDAT